MNNKEILELTAFLADVANAIEKSLRDGVINLTDFTNFVNAAISAPNAIQGIDKIGEELKNMSDADRAQVIVLFQEKLEFEAENVESAVEDLFTAAILLITAVTKLGLKLDGPVEGSLPVSE